MNRPAVSRVPPVYRAWANALSAGVKIFMPAGAKTIYAPHVEHVP